MVGVSKYYDKKAVLKDIYLSYFYGAKIGVLGLNGSGKSSLLRILAGVDKEFVGETVISPGYTVGFLEQEPQLDESKTVREIVEEGVQETVDLLKEFDEINAKFGEPMTDDEMDSLLERQGEVQEKLDAADAWDLDSRLEMAMDALRCPPGETPVKSSPAARSAASRSAGCCCKSRTSCCSTSRPTTSTPNRSAGSNSTCRNTRARSSPSRTTATFSTTSPAGFWNSTAARASRGRATTLRGWNRSRSACAAKRRPRASGRRPCSASWNGFAMSPKGRQAKGKARINSYEALLTQESEKPQPGSGDLHPARAAPGQIVIEAEQRRQGLRRQPARRGHDLSPPAGRHRRRHRAERRGQDDALPHDHRAGAAGRRHDHASARRSSSPTSTRAATRSTRTRPSGRRSPAART